MYEDSYKYFRMVCSLALIVFIRNEKQISYIFAKT